MQTFLFTLKSQIRNDINSHFYILQLQDSIQITNFIIIKKFILNLQYRIGNNSRIYLLLELQLPINMSGEIQKQFLLTSKIGNGNFSTVYLAKHISTQQIVAVKIMKNHIPIAIKEAQILKKINHPNVIKLYQFQKLRNKEQALIVLQYVPQNILELYQSQEYGLKEDQIKCILFQSCLGLDHIHKKGIIHRDVKPQNIMINRNKAQVKLIDFGLAIQQNNCCTDYVATRWYRAPQNLLGTKQYTVSIDIFSLGCVIVQLYLGNPLFPGSHNVDQISKIISLIGLPTMQSWRKGYQQSVKLGLSFQIQTQKRKTTLKTVLSSCPEGLAKLIQKMLVLNPFKRITAEQILRDSYFKDIEKIVPPQVYERYLLDIKPTSTDVGKKISIIVIQSPKVNKRNQSQERVRFLSQQKGFCAFSSFKSAAPLNKLPYETNRLKQTDTKHKKSPTENPLSDQKLKQIEDRIQKNQLSQSKKSKKTSFIKSQIINKIHITQTNDHTDINSNIKSSVQKYENNMLKFSNSLNNIKLLNSNQELDPDKNYYNKSRNSADMLSFRGFNHPKQKIFVKQGVFNFKNKNNDEDEKSKQFAINQKVMEYLQRFQYVASQSQLQRHKLQQSRSQPVIYQNLKVSKTLTPRKSDIFICSGSKYKQMRGRQTDSNKISLSQSNYRLSSKERVSYDNNFPNNLGQSSHNQALKCTKISDQEHYFLKSHNYLNSPMKMSRFESLQDPKPKTDITVKFSLVPRQQFQSQSSFMISQNVPKNTRIITSNQRSCYPVIKNRNTISSGQLALNAMQSNQVQMSSIFVPNGNTNNTNNPNNINRSVQNKIKLIAVRDSHHNIEQGRSNHYGPVSTSQILRNPTFYSNNHVEQTRPPDNNIYSPGKQSIYQHRNSMELYPSLLQTKENVQISSQQKAKFFKSFKSSEHRQFFIKKPSNNRYSINTTDQHQKVSYNDNYNSQIGRRCIISEIKKQSQKNHQTTLSQLRQSITGLAQKINQGTFHSSRSQKLNQKNININFNVNIYEDN